MSVVDKGRVTDKWIEANYDIQKERGFKKVTNYFTFEKSETLSVEDFFNKIVPLLDNTDNVRVSSSGKVEFGKVENFPESYVDVVQRLKTKEIAKRKDDAIKRKEYKEFLRLKEKFEPAPKEPTWDGIKIAFSVPASEVK